MQCPTLAKFAASVLQAESRMLVFALVITLSASALPGQALLPPDNAEQLRIADSQCQLRQFQEAENSYKKLLTTSPTYTEALTGLGNCYLSMGRPLEAARVLNEVLRRKGDDRNAKRDLAHALVDLRQFEPAERLLKGLVTTDPSDKESWFYLGVLMYQSGYYGSADEYLEKAIDTSATDSNRALKISIDRAVCWVHLGREKEAEALMNSLAKDPAAQKDPDLLLVFAQLLYETGRLERALERIDQAIQSRPDLAMGYVWRGKVLYRMGRFEDAATAEEKAMHMIPEFSYPRSLLLKIYQAQGRTEKAAEQAEWLRAYEDRLNSDVPR